MLSLALAGSLVTGWAWSAVLAPGGSAISAPSETAPSMPSSVLPRQDGKNPLIRSSGASRTLERRSQLSDIDEICRRYQCNRSNLRQRFPAAGQYRIESERFFLSVPPSSETGEARSLLVWLSPTDRGDLWFERVRALLERRNVVFVAAHRAGNRRAKWDRMGLALDAAEVLVEELGVDRQRVWVGGYSGGGRLASHLAWLYPDVFHGAIVGFGCDSPWSLPVPGEPGKVFRASFPLPDDLAVLANRRFVLATGSADFNRVECRAVFETMHDAGMEATFVELASAGHSEGLSARWLEPAVDFLQDTRSRP